MGRGKKRGSVGKALPMGKGISDDERVFVCLVYGMGIVMDK